MEKPASPVRGSDHRGAMRARMGRPASRTRIERRRLNCPAAPAIARCARSTCLPGENARCPHQSKKAAPSAAGDRPPVTREMAACALRSRIWKAVSGDDSCAIVRWGAILFAGKAAASYLGTRATGGMIDRLNYIASAYVLRPPLPLISPPLDSRRALAFMNSWASARRCLPSSAINSNQWPVHSW